VQHKHMFDPHGILALGQNIFHRNQKTPGLDQLLSLHHALNFWEYRRIPKSHFRECERKPHTSFKVGL